MNSEMMVAKGTKVRRINLSRKVAPCPRCTYMSKRHTLGKRRLREIGVDVPTLLEVTYSKHYCDRCKRHFSLSMSHLALPHNRFTNRVRRTAVSLVKKQMMTLEKASEIMRQKYHVRIPSTTLHDWTVLEMDGR